MSSPTSCSLGWRVSPHSCPSPVPQSRAWLMSVQGPVASLCMALRSEGEDVRC